MMIQSISHRPCCTIIPPHMTKKIKESCQDGSLRDIARHNLQCHKHLRESRAEFFCGQRQASCKITKNTIVKVYDAQHEETLPGVKVSEPWDSPDIEMREAYKWGQKTHEFYKKKFNRNSINNKGMLIVSTTHFGKGYDNAFWDGEQMVYGDGDGKIFTRFTIDPDVVGHELAHGVTQYIGPLVYSNQSGALNESISDVFGIMIKQYIDQQTVDQSDWLIGENVLKRKNCALRSMKAPGTAYVGHPQLGTDPQPQAMDNYKRMKDDNGGVHINSGIPNHAFYIFSDKLKDKYPYSWQLAGKVWHLAQQKLKPTAQFADFVQATIDIVDEKCGEETREAKEIRYAWAEVKLFGHKPAPLPPSEECILS